MNCAAEYIDMEGNEKIFYWLSSDYGTKKDCIKAMEATGIKYKEITGIWSSD